MTRYRMRLRRPAFRGIAVPFVRRERVATRLILVGLLSIALTVLLWWWATQTVGGQRIGDLVLYGRTAADSEALDLATQTLGLISLTSAGVATVGLALIALWRGGPGLSLAVLVSVGGANVTSQVLKRVLDRPDLLGDLAYATGNSFPSGHVTLAASIAFAVILLAPRGLRGPAALLAALAVAAIALSTISLAWHRLADVAGATLIALAWAALTTALLVLLQGWMPRRTWARGRGGRLIGTAVALGTVAVAIGVVVLAVGVVASDGLEQAIALASSEPIAFVAALVAAVGTSLLGAAAYVWAMNGVALETA